MEASTLWWIAAGCAVGVELLLGSFYLLLVALGLAAAAVVAHLGLSVAGQLVMAGAVGGGSVAVWRRYRQGLPTGTPAESNRDVNMDIGEAIEITAWTPVGHASARYRGARWAVAPAPGYTQLETGPHRIVEVVGIQLIVRKA